MKTQPEDCAKRRLTQRSHIIVAVGFLVEHGIARDDIAGELSRYYYVDIDELNDVLAGLPETGLNPAEISAENRAVA